MTPVETLVVLVIVVAAFLGGLAAGSLDDPSEVAPEVRYLEVPEGDFHDVPMRMTTTMGTTFHYLCDLHFTGPIDTAECEHQGVTYVLTALVIAADQVTKVGYDAPVNAGLAFSEGHGSQSWVQLTAALGATIAVACLFRRPWWAVGLALGGLLSSLLDRLVYGGVKDPFLHGIYWNLADVAAAIGLLACAATRISTQREEVT